MLVVKVHKEKLDSKVIDDETNVDVEQDTHYQCSSSSIGLKGQDGDVGNNGSKGINGSHGIIGEKGFPGPIGEQV
jgi:hypothetical protein